MPSIAFNTLIVQLNDNELSYFFYELGRQNSIQYIKKIISDDNMNSPHAVLLSAVDFGASTQGSVYWKLIFNRLKF